MGTPLWKQTAEMACRMRDDALSGAGWEYAVQFALRTGDRELTDKLMEELQRPGADREAVCRRFRVMENVRPEWIRDMENLLVSLELYRLQEEKALISLASVISVYSTEIVERETGGVKRGEGRVPAGCKR